MPAPNILLVVTDDQRLDTAVRTFMPKLMREVGDNGITFTRAIAPTPLCGPSRASILTGLRSIHHGLISNYGDTFFADGDTLPVRLKAVGYRTGLFGKYLNRYSQPGGPPWYVPPGWDEWNVLVDDTSQYLGYRLLQGQTIVQKGSAAADYSTDVLLALVKTFIQGALTAGDPFFAMVTPYAPHVNTNVFFPTDYPIPAPRHRGAYQRTSVTIDGVPYPLPLYRPPSWAEFDRSDKPAKVLAYLDTAQRRVWIEGIRQGALEALLAVDDLVGDLSALLTAQAAADNTVFVYTSDNGIQLYEHMLQDKPWAYEEAIRVPLLVRYPAVLGVDSRTESRQLILPDVTATLLEWAGANTSNLDGQSFAAKLANPNLPIRDAVPLEAWDIEFSATPVVPLKYRGIRTNDWKYVSWPNGDEELYDLRTDSAALNLVEANISSDRYEINSRPNLVLNSVPVKDALIEQMNILDAGGVGLQTKVGWFKTVSSGTQDPIPVGFRPKAVLFFLNHLGSDADALEGPHAYLCIGFAVGTGLGNQGYVAVSHNDNSSVASGDNVTGRQLRNDRCIGHVTPGNPPTQAFDGSLLAFDADAFRITWNSPPGAGYRVTYFALGGHYIKNTASLTVAKPTAPGAVAISTLTFTPDVLFFFADNRLGLGTVPATNSAMMFGWATRVDGNQGVASMTCKAGANPTDTYRLQRSDRCIACLLPDGSAESMRASVQSWDANGFTLNFDVADNVARSVICLAIKAEGAVWRSGVLTQPIAGGAQTQNVTTDGGPATAALFLSTNDTTEASINPDARLTIGAASIPEEAWPSANSPQRGTVWVGNRDAQTTTVARSKRDSNHCLVMHTESAPNTPSTENARADYNGSRPNGFKLDGFQLDWEAIDMTARRILWLAVSRT